jgi:hypothetical protein
MILRRIVNRFVGQSSPVNQQHHASNYPSIYLSQQVIIDTAKLLRTYGTQEMSHEGIVYWAGVACERCWVITTAFAPVANTTYGSYKTDLISNAIMISRLNEMRLRLIAQVHSHPGDWVGHSDGDNLGAFMPYDGFYSVVVPSYAKQGLLPLTNCGFHRYEKIRFRELSPTEIVSTFAILPSSVDLRE